MEATGVLSGGGRPGSGAHQRSLWTVRGTDLGRGGSLAWVKGDCTLRVSNAGLDQVGDHKGGEKCAG